jgi:hypothetical protein
MLKDKDMPELKKESTGFFEHLMKMKTELESLHGKKNNGTSDEDGILPGLIYKIAN